MPPKSQSESKQGLIITLVFFILATLGLGVATYSGFADQERLTKDVAKEKADAKLFKEQRDWYLFQAQMYRSYMGQAQTLDGVADLGTKKAQFDQGVMKGDKLLDKDEVTKLLKELEKKFKWKGNKPEETYEDRIAKLGGENEALEKRNQGLQTALAEAKATNKKRDDEITAANGDYLTNLNKLKEDNKTDQSANIAAVKSARDKLDKVSAQWENDKKKANEDRLALEKKLKTENGRVGDLKKLVVRMEDEIGGLRLKSTVAPPSMRTDWKIVKMDRRGTNPYINLGSADKVRPQLTFSIHGVGLDGRPILQPKGTLEVVNVIGDHLSRTRITSAKDANRDPILEGDVLYNPSWNPTIKKHVAVAGFIDLTGDGRDSLAEFLRNLARQNVVVDAWLDPKDGSIKGKGITLQTDYLILGDSQEFSPTGREKPPSEAQKRGRQDMIDAAAKNGVKPLDLHKYLEMIGYRLPRSTGGERQSLYDPSLRPDKAPRLGGDKVPVMPPNK